MKLRGAVVVPFVFMLGGVSAEAADPAITSLKDDEEAVVYWEANLSGVVWLSIRAKDGMGCAELKWRNYPLFFLDQNLGRQCGKVRLDIPGIGRGAVVSTLSARAVAGSIKIIGSSNERVAYDYPPVTFP